MSKKADPEVPQRLSQDNVKGSVNRMTIEQLEVLADALETRFPVVEGWTFSLIHPTFFQFSKGQLCVMCTPDNDFAGVISLEIQSEDGDTLDGEDVRYSQPLSAETFVEVMSAHLLTIASRFPKLVEVQS